jgi:hypothetical protein
MRGISTTRLRALWVAAAVTVTALAIGAGSALATVIDRGHYTDTDSFAVTDCPGLTFDVASTVEGQFRLRADKGGQAFFLRDTSSYREIWTNRATGKWFAIEGHSTYNETKAVLVEGNVYKFTAIESGQPFTIVDSNGSTVVRDRGSIRQVYTFDTLGDGQPGGVTVDVLETSVHGPHPGFADDFPFCEIAADLTT